MADPVKTGEQTNQPPTADKGKPSIDLIPAAERKPPVREIPPGKPVTPAPADDAAAKAAADQAAADAAAKAAADAAAAVKPPEDAAAAKAAADKAASDKAAADAAAKAAADAAADKVPDKYELKAPEGLTLDTALVEAVAPVFKELGITSKAAQKLTDAVIDFQKGAAGRMLAADLEVTMKDPVVGGMNYAKTQAAVNRALAAFTTPADRAWFDKAGIGNRLEFVRVFRAIGEAMADDIPPVGGTDGGTAPKSMADRLYGSSGG